MSERFVKLPVKIKYEDWYIDANTCLLYVHCLISAAWKEHEFKGITIHKGEFPTSYRKLSAETGLSVRQIRTSIDKLEAAHFLTHFATQKATQLATQKTTQKATQGNFTIIKVLRYVGGTKSDTQNDTVCDTLSDTTCDTESDNTYRIGNIERDIEKDIKDLGTEEGAAALTGEPDGSEENDDWFENLVDDRDVK